MIDSILPFTSSEHVIEVICCPVLIDVVLDTLQVDLELFNRVVLRHNLDCSFEGSAPLRQLVPSDGFLDK